jgi:hypothetical protein
MHVTKYYGSLKPRVLIKLFRQLIDALSFGGPSSSLQGSKLQTDKPKSLSNKT